MFNESIDYCATPVEGNYFNSIVHTIDDLNIFIVDSYICEFLNDNITSLEIQVKINCCDTPILSRVLNIIDTDVEKGFIKLNKDLFFNQASSDRLKAGIYEITLNAVFSNGIESSKVNSVFIPNTLICDVAQAIIKSNINTNIEGNRADLIYNSLVTLSKAGCSNAKDMCIIYALLLKELNIQNGKPNSPCSNC